jgi:Uma2 family endonuclease
MTLEEFLELPEEEPALELEPDGTVIQKKSPKGRHSSLQGAFVELINRFARPRRLAFAFAELRTVFGGAAYVPDVAVYRWDRIAWTADGEVPDDFFEPPDIAIEVVSPKQGVNSLVRRCLWYVDNAVHIAVLVDPDDRSVLVFRAGATTRAFRGADSIDFSDVLPGFELSVDRLFSALRGELN